MKKRILSALLSATIAASALAGCGTAKNDEKTNDVQQSTIEFWYHDGNETSNGIFAELISRFQNKYPQYKVNYVGLPSDSYLQKYNTAIATNSVPDTMSVRDQDISAIVNQEALLDLEDAINSFDEKDSLNKAILKAVRNCATDGKLYAFPEYFTCDISWANTALMKEKGVEVPKTIDEFMAACKKYADTANGKYFYSLRGGTGSMENLLDFLFTYADQDSLFDKDGNCVLDQPIFTEALDAYASIYWNGWTSKDSVTNGFKEMVAEFGSGTSMYISHNSSSLAEHKKNLGEGNFINVFGPANKNGNVVTKNLTFTGFAVTKKAKNPEGAVEFVKFLANSENQSYLCEKEGRVPANEMVYKKDWYQNDKYMKVYTELLNSDHVKFITHPVWLSGWGDFKAKYQEPDLQAVILKDKTSKEVLKSWAAYLTKLQKEYLNSNK